VRKYHPNDRIEINGQWQTVKFPTPRPIQVDYDLDQAYPGLLDRVAAALEPYTYGVAPAVAVPRRQPCPPQGRTVRDTARGTPALSVA
jgi:hypothetical protein